MNNTTFFLTMLLLISPVVMQLKSQEVTLEQFIEAALLNNPAMKLAENESSIAELEIKKASSRRFASVNIETSGGLSEQLSLDNDYTSGYAKLSADQLIWQNKSVISSIEQARYAGAASKSMYEARKQEIIISVKTVFFTCQQQYQLYKISRENVARAEVFLEYARDRYYVGFGRKSDILKAESDLAEAEFEQVAYLNAFRKSRNDLAMLTGLVPEELSISDSTWQIDTLMYSTVSSDSLIGIAFTRYPELQATFNLGYSQQYKIKEVQSAYYPELVMNAGYEWSYNPVIQGQKGWYTMLTMRWNIFSGNSKRYQVQSEFIKKESYENRASEIRNYLTREVNNRLLSLVEAKDQINLTRSQMRTTTENLEIAKAQYKAGTGSMLELTDARITDLLAQKNNIKAMTEYRIAIANLEGLTGKTIENE